MPSCRTRLLSVATVGLASFLACATSALGAQTVIDSAGPLTSIYVNDDLGCSVDRASQTQVFGGTDPGSCGTFLAVGGSVYGPAGVGPATDVLDPVSQTPSGSGSSIDPFKVVTIADAGATLLRLTQTDSYVVGDDFYTTVVEVSNTGSSQAVDLYHAADCALRGDDEGVGYNLASAIYCSRGPSGAALAAGVLGFEPISPAGAKFMEGDFSSVFGAINGDPLPNTCDCSVLQDNGAGISWSVNAPTGSTSFSFRTRVSADTRAPQTTITDGPGPGSTSETTPTFSFQADEPSATFECSVDGPAVPTAPCDDDFSHTTSPLSPGPHVFRVTATDPDGNQDASPATASFTVSGSPASPGPVTAVPVATGLPKPVLGKTANVGLVSGKVRVRRKGSKGFVTLTGPTQMPVGSTVDTKKGRVSVTMAATRGKTSTAQFYDGVFQVLQAKSKDPVAEMKLVGSLQGCGGKGKGSSEVRAGAKKRSKRGGRRLRGTAKGPFRMRGTYSSATIVVGTWLVQDGCNRSTLTVVGSGRVAVRDFAKRKTIRLKKGKRYIARSRKRKARR